MIEGCTEGLGQGKNPFLFFYAQIWAQWVLNSGSMLKKEQKQQIIFLCGLNWLE